MYINIAMFDHNNIDNIHYPATFMCVYHNEVMYMRHIF